jgi:hypothetical protein
VILVGDTRDRNAVQVAQPGSMSTRFSACGMSSPCIVIAARWSRVGLWLMNCLCAAPHCGTFLPSSIRFWLPPSSIVPPRSAVTGE